MQNKINKKIIIISVIAIALIVVMSIVLFNKKEKYDYYYTFTYDDNLISQSVKVYDSKGKLQTNYYIFNGEEVVTLTEGEKAVLTINNLDLKEKPELTIVFKEDGKKYTLGPKE